MRVILELKEIQKDWPDSNNDSLEGIEVTKKKERKATTLRYCNLHQERFIDSFPLLVSYKMKQ